MEEQAFYLAMEKLLESGALDNLNQPGAQTAIIYALLIVLGVLSFRVFVLNGSVKRFFDLEEKKLHALNELNMKLLDVQNCVRMEHEKISDLMRFLQAKRHTDYPDAKR